MKENEAIVSMTALCCFSAIVIVFLIQQCAIEDIKYATTNSGKTLYYNKAK